MSVSHSTALAILLPDHLWPRIQSIRYQWDRSFERWPPHVNLMYPFLLPGDQDLVSRLEAVFAEWEPFQVRLNERAVFPNYVCHHVLRPDSLTLTGKPSEFSRLGLQVRQAIRSLYPPLKDQKKPSVSHPPHLTVATSPKARSKDEIVNQNQEAEELEQKIEQAMKGLDVSILVQEVVYLMRNDDEPFRIYRRFPLKGVKNDLRLNGGLVSEWIQYNNVPYQDGQLIPWPVYSPPCSPNGIKISDHEASFIWNDGQPVTLLSWNLTSTDTSLSSSQDALQPLFQHDADLVLLQACSQDQVRLLWSDTEHASRFTHLSHRPEDVIHATGDTVLLSRFAFTAQQVTIKNHGAVCAHVMKFQGEKGTVVVVNVNIPSEWTPRAIQETLVKLMTTLKEQYQYVIVAGNIQMRSDVIEGVGKEWVDAWTWLKARGQVPSDNLGMTYEPKGNENKGNVDGEPTVLLPARFDRMFIYSPPDNEGKVLRPTQIHIEKTEWSEHHFVRYTLDWMLASEETCPDLTVPVPLESLSNASDDDSTFWAEQGGSLSYVLCIDRSASNSRGSERYQGWNAGANTFNLVRLCEHLLSIPDSRVYVVPWGSRPREKLHLLQDIRLLMSLRCVSVRDAGQAKLLNRFRIPTAEEDAQAIFDGIETRLRWLERNYSEEAALDFHEERARLEAQLLSLMPPNSTMDYKGGSSFSQLLDGLTFATQLEDNVVILIQTDGLLDALKDPDDRESERITASSDDQSSANFRGELGRKQLCEKLRKLAYSKTNLVKILLQFAVHTEPSVIDAFTSAFSDVCVEIIGQTAATHGFLDMTKLTSEQYFLNAKDSIPDHAFRCKPGHISISWGMNSLLLPQVSLVSLKNLLDDIPSQSQKRRVFEHLVQYLCDRIDSVQFVDHGLFQKQIADGYLGILYGAICRLSAAYQYRILAAYERHEQPSPFLNEMYELLSSVTNRVSRVMQQLQQEQVGRKELLEYLILKSKEDPDEVNSLKTYVETFADRHKMKPFCHFGVGYYSEKPTVYDAQKAVGIDQRHIGLIIKHIREFESSNDQTLIPCYIDSKSNTPLDGYKDFMTKQWSCILTLLLGNVIVPRMNAFMAMCSLLIKPVGVLDSEVDPKLHRFLSECIKYYPVQSIMPDWKIDDDGGWIFEQANMHMNPNFWRSVLLALRYQPELGNQELIEYKEILKTSSHLVHVTPNKNGTISLINNSERDMFADFELSFEANRLQSQMELFKGLTRLKALQYIASIEFRSAQKFKQVVTAEIPFDESTAGWMQNSLIPMVPVVKGRSIWLPNIMVVNQQFDASHLPLAANYVSVIYSRYQKSMIRYNQHTDTSVMETSEEYVKRWYNFLLRHVFNQKTSKTAFKTVKLFETREIEDRFSLPLKDVLTVFGSTFFGIHPKLLERVLETSNLKLTRDDVRELAKFATQPPCRPAVSLDEIVQHKFSVKSETMGRQTVCLTHENWKEITDIYTSKLEAYLNPPVHRTTDVETLSLCCCCMETMAFHFEGDSKCINLACNHQLCNSCANRMIATALELPLQLVVCPYCRGPVNMETLQKICRESPRNAILYERYVLNSIPRFAGFEPYDVASIQKAMKAAYFGLCQACKNEMASVEKACARGIPPASNFKCSGCFRNEQQLDEKSFDVRCPHCEIPVDRIDGCNFMTCRCGGYFCFLCGNIIGYEHHFSHFHDAPFGKTCRNRPEMNCSCRFCIKRGKKKKAPPGSSYWHRN